MLPEEYKYIERVCIHMKFFKMFFGKSDVFDTKCEYTSRCAAYKSDSHTCTDEVDKNYCGIYKQFLKEA
jgi:hypothetical protein